MSSLNLRTHEVRHYLATGEVCVVRACPEKWTPLLEEIARVNGHVATEMLDGDLPLPYPGSVVSCREKWWYGPQPDRVEYDADMDGDARDAARLYGAVLLSASTMPAWAIRPELRDARVASVEVKRVQDVTTAQILAPDFDAHAKRGRKWADNPYVSVVTLRREG